MKNKTLLLIVLSLLFNSCSNVLISQNLETQEDSESSSREIASITEELTNPQTVEFFNLIKGFREKIYPTNSLSEAALKEEPYYKYLQKFFNKSENKCSLERVSLDPINYGEVEHRTDKVDVGIFKRIVKQGLRQEEKDLKGLFAKGKDLIFNIGSVDEPNIPKSSNKKYDYFSDSEPPEEWVKINKEAKLFHRSMDLILQDPRFTFNDQLFLLVKYLENILIPMRNLALIKRAYLKNTSYEKYFMHLMPTLPKEFSAQLGENHLKLLYTGTSLNNKLYMTINPVSMQLEFHYGDIIKADMMTLISAPLKENVLLASKWMTLHMMLSQASIYQAMLGNSPEIDTPKSCTNKDNGNFPKIFSVTMGSQDKIDLHEMLKANGFLSDSDEAGELKPYEVSKMADVATKKESLRYPSLGATFDDRLMFNQFMKFRDLSLHAIYKGFETKKNRMLKFKYLATYASKEWIEDVISSYSETDKEVIKINGKDETISPIMANLSKTMVKEIRLSGKFELDEFIPEEIKNTLKQTKIRFDFPSYYSNQTNQLLAMNALKQFVNENKDVEKSSIIYKQVTKACDQVHGTAQNICGKNNILLGLAESFSDQDNFINSYPMWAAVWDLLLKDKMVVSEWEYLLDQQKSQNPFARLRLSYLLARYRIKNLPRTESCSESYYDMIDEDLGKMALALGIDKPLSSHVIESALSESEKGKLWVKIKTEFSDASGNLFAFKNSNGENYIDEMSKISNQVILSKLAFNKLKPKNLSDELQAKADAIPLNNIEFLTRMYFLKDRPEEQKKYFETFILAHPDINPKDLFIQTNNSFKEPLLLHQLRMALLKGRQDLMNKADRLCRLSKDNHSELKAIHYSTLKAQNLLNEQKGLIPVPEYVLNEMESMSPEEWQDTKLSFAGMGLILFANIFAGSCMGMTGGICMPVALATSWAATGLFSYTASNEAVRNYEENQLSQWIQGMIEIGYTDPGAESSLSHTYLSPAFNAMNSLMLTKMMAKSALLNYRFFSGNFRDIKSLYLEEQIRDAHHILGIGSANIDALTILEKKASLATVENKKKVETIFLMYKKGKLSFDDAMNFMNKAVEKNDAAWNVFAKKLSLYNKELGPVSVTHSPDRELARTVARYFDNDPLAFKRYLQTQSIPKVERAEDIFSAMIKGELRMKANPPTVIYDKVANSLTKLKYWYSKLRYEQYFKHAANLNKWNQELSNTKNLEDYISSNIEEMTDFFINIPMKKREIFYQFGFAGFPESHYKDGRAYPVLSYFSKGQVLKKMFGARAFLSYEWEKKMAANKLGLGSVPLKGNYLKILASFENSVMRIAEMKSDEEKVAILNEYLDFRRMMLIQVYMNYASKFSFKDQIITILKSKSVDVSKLLTPKLEADAFAEIFLNVKSPKDVAFIDELISHADMNAIFKSANPSPLAHKVLKSIKTDIAHASPNEMQAMYDSLMIMFIKEHPEAIHSMQ